MGEVAGDDSASDGSRATDPGAPMNLPGWSNSPLEGLSTEAELDVRSRYDLVFESKLIGIGFLDAQGRLVDANGTFSSLCGRSLGELTCALDARTLFHPDTRGKLEQYLLELRSSSTLPRLDADFLWKDGTTVPVLLGSAGQKRDSGISVLLAVDMRERKYTEQSYQFLLEAGAVLASSLDVHRTLEGVSELVVPRFADWCLMDIATEDGDFERVVVAHADPEGAELAQSLRRTRCAENARALSRESRLHVDVTDEVLTELSRERTELALLGGTGIRSLLVVPMVARNQILGQLTFLSCRFNYDSLNLGCAEELARRAAMSVDAARLYCDAQEAARIREEFLSIASHELRTPLSSLKLQAQGLLRILRTAPPDGQNSQVYERVGRGLDLILRQVERQTRLVDNLLDVSKISAGRLSLDPEEFDACELIEDIVSRHEPESVRLRTPIRVQLPQTAVVVKWDRMRAEHLLNNLISNAIKYGAQKPVDVRLEASGKSCRIYVQDSGIGISPKDCARVFGRFERAVSTRHFGGFGLGLWICNSIVEAMGGSVSVESEVGCGSKFTVQLPRRI